ncbi:hypothetical protein ACH5RR_035002 [Cinchona calisaya]|uniref:Uncharacterized protein n=1 Tax=Cinchona calisaya TaxID=153742 RepID=A0ABD2YCK4_9GENT
MELFGIFDYQRREESKYLYEYSFSEHTLKVIDVATGYGGCNAIIVSTSEDQTCKIWSLSQGKLLRNIVFPSIIDAVVLVLSEHVFYGLHIIGSLSEHSKAITCLGLSMDGYLSASGSEDGMVRVWDTKTCNISHIFQHSKATRFFCGY